MYASPDLQWLLLRKTNSYIVKRVPEGPVFSKEPGNLLNLHSHKYSGLTDPKTIAVDQAPNGGISITTRKLSSGIRSVRKSQHQQSIRPRSGPRRAHGVAVGQAKRGYRPDLRKAALARVSALLAVQKGPSTKPVKEKKPRSARAKKAAAASA
ncbi:ribosomal protein L28e [Sistotremastrum niveocremeum HHB9708]|uniref:Ribosomal protein L28e n=2 Tax=Sistotremastraceae TaxID=3402574 RepID=A0A164ULY8_9AGAM|nr:ribosomal protein L28e [Sistotremastrum niveocremeum HHB9708]KZT43841.1 ribosomal protein L28e [Sistotremastrum suecicum HHB10207 ss-3]